ncbi:hypothetical protein OV287_56075 [Archangium sp. miwbw1]|uniref:Uncharacterized protein n=1 Tax=Archangium lansingense TaxID=2995310 RepID=A0ABT4ARJ7_9BACT|nr:hypothetical protein [Archangium lansinium]MCY1083794.1 hypothetical protein [Archangium lansinium]
MEGEGGLARALAIHRHPAAALAQLQVLELHVDELVLAHGGGDEQLAHGLVAQGAMLLHRAEEAALVPHVQGPAEGLLQGRKAVQLQAHHGGRAAVLASVPCWAMVRSGCRLAPPA